MIATNFAEEPQIQRAQFRRPEQFLAPDRTIFAEYTTNAANSIANATWTIVDYEDKVVDTHNAVTIGASWKFTAPATRYYAVSAYNFFTTTTAWAIGEIAGLDIYKNGASYRSLHNDAGLDSSGASCYREVKGYAKIFLKTGEYIDIRIYQATGDALALHNSGIFNWITITGRAERY